MQGSRSRRETSTLRNAKLARRWRSGGSTRTACAQPGAISRLAQAAFARGEIERAGVLWGAAKYEFTRTPTRFDFEWFGGRLVTETNPIFRAAIERGRLLTLWDAAAVALGELKSPQTLS
ncbi:hypothetical protein BH09ACT13_BH09ACT13_15430 [soil metagenome]